MLRFLAFLILCLWAFIGLCILKVFGPAACIAFAVLCVWVLIWSVVSVLRGHPRK